MRENAAGEGRAWAAFDAVQSDPPSAEAELRAIINETPPIDRAAVIARWGLGRLLYDGGDIAGASVAFAEALVVAAAAGYSEEPQLRLSWSLCLQSSGDYVGALAQLSLAELRLSGGPLGRLKMQRGVVLMLMGSIQEAVDDYDAALHLIREDGDGVGEARLLGNRGIALSQIGRVVEARNDHLRAASLGEQLGLHLVVALSAHNLGYLFGRLGQVPEALDAFGRARAGYTALGSPGRLMAALDTDQCELQLFAGFPEEAKEVAARLIADARSVGNLLQLADSHLLLARAELMLGNRRAATEQADQAARLFTDTGRRSWAALAAYVGVMAATDIDGELIDDEPTAALTRLDEVAATLGRLGWSAEAAEVRVVLSRLALRRGLIDIAVDALASASAVRRRGTARLRAEVWHATALLHLVAGDRTRARRAIESGLRVVDRHRATLGASEMRVHASAHGVALARLGLRLALETGRAGDVLVAAERWRAGSLAAKAGVARGDAQLDADLSELRRLERSAHDSRLSGTGVDADAGAARDSIAALEHRITDRTRLAPGDPRATAGRLDIARLRRELGDETLVEYVDIDGRLHAVVVPARGRVRLIRLGTSAEIGVGTEHLLFALRRLSALPAGHRMVAAARDAFGRSADELAQQLVAPLDLPGGPIVIVPTGGAHALPWAALPGLRRAAGMTVTPSAAWWLRSGPVPPMVPAHKSTSLLVAGPDLPHAAAELAAIASITPSAIVLTGDAATTENVLEAMADADLVHIAAHGVFRADSPMFSSLQLADGPLMVHDLERLRRTPQTVILSACNAARSGAYNGDELLGTAVALLSLGVSTVVAPLLPVPDETTATFAVAIHRALVAGAAPAVALGLAAEAAFAGDDGAAIAVAASFHCVGRDII